MALTIQSPGVEIQEHDLTLRPVLPVGTNVLVLGFAPQGPTDSVIQVSDFGDFQTIYGTPTNAAERYFYHTVKAVSESSANILVGRLAYGSGLGSGFGNTYTALVYPVLPVSPSLSSTSLSGGYLSACSLSATTQGYIIGEPYQVSLSQTDYNTVAQGQVAWQDVINMNTALTNISAFGQAGIIVLNTARTTINDKYEGYYLGIADNSYVNPATNFNAITKIFSVNQTSGSNFVQVPSNRLSFALSSTPTATNGSISQTEENITPFDIGTSLYNDTVILGVFKLGVSVYAPTTLTLNYNLVEGYTGSLDSRRRVQNTTGGAPSTFFIGDVEDNSPNIELFVNPSISRVTGTWIDPVSSIPTKFVRTYKQSGTGIASIDAAVGTVLSPVDVLIPLGSYGISDSTTLQMGAIPDKINRLLTLVANVETQQIDVTCEAGLATIYVMSRNAATLSASNYFDDTQFLNLSGTNGGLYKLSEGLNDTLAQNIHDDFVTVQNTFINFAEQTRKDHLYVSDVLRNVLVQGQDTKVLSDANKTFSIFTYWPLKHLYDVLNSSYACAYADWVKRYDANTDSQFWCPFSGQAASIMANTDSLFQPWIVPAGFTRGIVKNVSDIAIAPEVKQRDMLYKIAMNPVAQFPDQGFIVFGQKTLFRNPSAFDRINVRRLFLFLEKATRETLKFYVFEPNTVVTRNRVIQALTPIMELAKNTEGLYDYLIVCDERNNTPTIIDQNELVVDIYIKPVRAAEFILVNFYATQTGQDFSEITG